MNEIQNVKCRVCGRALKNPKSLKVGLGPICARKVIPDGAGAVNTKEQEIELPLENHDGGCRSENAK